jgi:uncharacterized protein YbjT (DUF2867 family)
MSAAPEGYALVPVERGTEAEAARALLAVAGHPREVVWVPGRSEFRVPDAVAERYREALAGVPAESKTTRPRRNKRSESNG